MKEVKINTDFIKLDQFLKWAGIVDTGGEAKNMVINGMIKKDGQTIFQRGKKLYKGDCISVEGQGEFIII